MATSSITNAQRIHTLVSEADALRSELARANAELVAAAAALVAANKVLREQAEATRRALRVLAGVEGE